MHARAKLRAAPPEAAADEILVNAKHKGELRRSQLSREAARKEELIEREHRRNLQALEDELELRRGLMARGFERIASEVEAGQRSVEWVAEEAVRILASDPANQRARPLDDDWLMRFCKYASEVDEQTILAVLARALADASIRGRPLISPRALDTVRFFEPHTKKMFDYAGRHIALFSAVPSHYFERDPKAKEYELNLPLLVEMGLLKYERSRVFSFNIGEIFFSFTFKPGANFEFDAIKLTQIGSELYGLSYPAARELQSIGGKPLPDARVWPLQTKFAISEKEVAFLAISLIQEMCDQGGLRTCVLHRSMPANRTIYDAERPQANLPFAIELPSDIEFAEAANKTLVEVFLKEFRDFDQHQLPALSAHMAE